MHWSCLALSAAAGSALLPTLAALVVNEVLYDPVGPDAGQEFVELFNSGVEPVALDAAQLRFVNGSAPSSSLVVWSGEPGLSLAPGAFFVLGADQVEDRDRTVTLGLQNGDEALELWVDASRVDAVAWGANDLALGEGSPAPPAPGQSLGRVPDGQDTDENARDFRALPAPTPGRVNLAAEDFALVRWTADPVWREDPGPVDLELELEAVGWAAIQRGRIEVDPDAWTLSAAAGDTVRIRVALDCALGPSPVQIRFGAEPTRMRDLAAVPLHCGIGALVLTEVQPRPADGEPEWLELRNRSGATLALAGWALRDRGGPSRALTDGDSLAAGARVVLTSDPAGLLARYPGTPSRILVPLGGWPSLNDTGKDAASAADSLHLLDPSGAVVDLVTWRAADIEERGRPLQRGALEPGQVSLWLPAVAGATPGAGAADEGRAWPPGGLLCVPDPFTPDGDGQGDELEVLVVGAFSRADARVFDLRGDLVRELPLVGSSSRRVARWDGRDTTGRPVPSGAYVVVVETDGEVPKRLRRVVGLGRAR